MTITFDRKLGLRRSKNESFSKLRNEALGPSPEGDSKKKIPKFYRLPYFFIFLLFFQIFRF